MLKPSGENAEQVRHSYLCNSDHKKKNTDNNTFTHRTVKLPISQRFLEQNKLGFSVIFFI